MILFYRHVSYWRLFVSLKNNRKDLVQLIWNYRVYYKRSPLLWDIILALQDKDYKKVKEFYDAYCRIACNRNTSPDEFGVWLHTLQKVYLSRI